MGKVAAYPEELTRQLNTSKPESADAMGGLQEKLSKEADQEMSVSEQRIELLSHLWKNKRIQLLTLMSY